MRRIFFYILRVLLLGSAIFLLTFSILGMVLSNSTVQSQILIQLQGFLARKVGTVVHIEQVEMALPSRFVLNGVYLEDDQGSILVEANQVQLDILSFPSGNGFLVKKG